MKTRQDYLDLRNSGREDVICYEYYKLKFDSNKHRPFLSFDEFIQYLVRWDSQQAIYASTDHYDREFHIISCQTNEKMIYL